MARRVDPVSAADRAVIARHGRLLQGLTIAWNALEFVIALAAGVASGSVALVGFGLDSAIEVTSSGAALWRLGRDGDHAARERAERHAGRVIGVCFVLLAIYVAGDALLSLGRRRSADVSLAGLVIAALSLIVMPVLVYFKRGVARALASGALASESRQTELCAYLSAILLAGLVLNGALGWWWADPVAALVMAPLIAREGVHALRGDVCCD